MPDVHFDPPRDAVWWFDRIEPTLPALHGRQEADLVVVGGGMMGLMCALTARAHGRTVCLLEATTCGAGASGRSSAFITPDSELELADLVGQFGREEGRRLWTFALGGVDAIQAAIGRHAIGCDYQPQDALFVAASAGGAEVLRREQATRAALGFASALYSGGDLNSVIGAENFFGGLRFGGTFGMDPYRFSAGVRRALLADGVRIFENSPVTRILAQGVETSQGAVHARHIAVCVDHVLPALGLAPREIYHAQTFLGISKPLAERDIARMFPAGPLMAWDTSLVYGYFRLTPDRRLLVGGSTLPATYARHERHRPAATARRLLAYLQRHFPGVAIDLEAVWPGLIGISKDFAPVVGRHPEHAAVHFASGAAGLPWAAALGGYLAEKILKGRDELDGVLGVGRKFPLGRRWHAVLGTPATFALAHGVAKFRAK